jgi:hypothetical protein
MASIGKGRVSYRLLDGLSNLVICSSCLRKGVVTPVPQVISGRHSLTNECSACRSKNPETSRTHRKRATLLTMPG